MYEILDKVSLPQDIRALDKAGLEQLCSDIRAYMVDCCSRNPGHLASSLGAVEIITALHYIFNTPEDKIVFDVGHQAYAHKILTGRKAEFAAMRTAGGISGFPKMSESPYDAFGVGHSSTSISAALGLAEASRLAGSDSRTIAVIGDGALTGGMAFEGLNNAGTSKANLLVILNDNNQSIDKNIGGLHNHLLNLTTNPAYNRLKDKVWNRMGESYTRNIFQRITKNVKSWFVRNSGGDFFESLGMRYFGPVDGNNISQLVDVLSRLKDIKGPVVLHCLTRKGKGYAPAEQNPTTWHAPGRFDPLTGVRAATSYDADRFQDVFGEVLLDLARKDARVLGVTPAMATGCGMDRLARELPDRFYDVGIEEEHAVTFSAGLAAGGMRPFCNIYSSFAQRAYDQIIHDVALQNLPVAFCFDRAGVVGEDGATHSGTFDIAAFRSIPGISIIAPKDEIELKQAMFTVLHRDAPSIIRYPRGTGSGADWRNAPYCILPDGKGEKLLEGDRIAVLAAGPCAVEAVGAAEDILKKTGEKVGVYNARFIKPIDTEMLEELAASYEWLVTVEDGVLKGGLYGAVTEYFAEHGHKTGIIGIGVDDTFVQHARQSEQRAKYGIDRKGIGDRLLNLIQKEKKVLE